MFEKRSAELCLPSAVERLLRRAAVVRFARVRDNSERQGMRSRVTCCVAASQIGACETSRNALLVESCAWEIPSAGLEVRQRRVGTWEVPFVQDQGDVGITIVRAILLIATHWPVVGRSVHMFGLLQFTHGHAWHETCETECAASHLKRGGDVTQTHVT